MRQVLFWIPLKPFDWLPSWWPEHIPLYGFGTMLFVVFLTTTRLAARRARREGIAPQYLQDLAIWIFAGGVVGARIVYMIQYHVPIEDFFKIWQGGLVFYGSAIGGVVGYCLAYVFVIRKHGLSTWKLADAIAPAAALGLCLGRVGCLLNGCCYGNVACSDCPGISFPLSSPARYQLVADGLQTAAGFTVKSGTDRPVVGAVEPGSPADEVGGLRAGDQIVAVDGKPVETYGELSSYLVGGMPRGKNDLSLTVLRGGRTVELSPFEPRTLRLNPTQVYESISMFLLFLLLIAYYPFRRRSGELMVLFTLGYSVHRFLDEMLRNDTPKLADGLTLSQNGSIFFFVVGILLAIWLWSRPVPRPQPQAAAAA
jgi:phosphatidylglycerol:prolipoprotein diacylglycerol transferase